MNNENQKEFKSKHQSLLNQSDNREEQAAQTQVEIEIEEAKDASPLLKTVAVAKHWEVFKPIRMITKEQLEARMNPTAPFEPKSF